MPAPYYDTHAARELHALPANMRIDHNGWNKKIDPANPEAVGILRLVPATPPDGFVIVASHGALIDGQWREVIDATKSLAEVEAEERAAVMPPPGVLEAALELSQCVDGYNAQFPGLDLGIGDGFRTLKIKVADGVDAQGAPIVPLEWKALVIDVVTLMYSQLEYRMEKWLGQTDVWSMLPQVAEALSSAQAEG
jgi:hypothetical protein